MSDLVVELPRVISLENVGKALNAKRRTVEEYLNRFDIPVTEFSQKNRGLTEDNYRLLIERATKREAA
jgi:hypothetical protein